MNNKFLLKDYKHIYQGCEMTKNYRHNLFGKVSGGSSSMKPEKYQRSTIENITGLSCNKTNTRINTKTNTIVNIKNPLIKENGFDYTENFDGIQHINNYNIYINLKCVVGTGGSQTRTLKDSYHFVESQASYLHKNNSKDILFANILDGDEAHKRIKNFNYLLNNHKYKKIKNNIYVGDLKGYFSWLNLKFCNN